MQPEPNTSRSSLQRLFGVALAGYWIALFIGTHIPLPELDDLPKNSDKLMHFVAYAGLSFLLGAWLSAKRGLTARYYAVVFGITAGYAVLDELLQIPVGRSCDLYDALADWTGSLIGLTLLAAVRLVLDRSFSPVRRIAQNSGD